VVSVNDTGVGIEHDILSKIFDPFFTTKKVSEGTGLGLAMTYSIVKQHKGFITVYSEPGIGSQFDLYIPVFSGEYKNELKDNGVLKTFNGELVLVADDDNVALKAICEMLEILRLKTIQAVNGDDAVELFRKHQDKIAVVILDLIMPVKSGTDAFLEIIKIKPDVKVIVNSGFTKDERIETLMAHGVKVFVQKPYSITKLKNALNEVLAK
jgi:CheY-like chemotaxis protein